MGLDSVITMAKAAHLRTFLSALVAVIVAGYIGSSAPQLPTSPWIIGPIIGDKNYSPGMSLHPIADGPNWYFDFPQAPESVHYVTRNAFEPGRNVIRMRFKIEGDAEFKATEGSARAAVRLMVQRRGDTYSSDKANYRFWSGPVQLAPGEFVVEEALTPDRWTNVGGQTDPAGFQALLDDLEKVGFTFGGQFAGHGVYAVGAARFVLTDYTLE
jgi:hypothetical protein